jgi:hypothetical protein
MEASQTSRSNSKRVRRLPALSLSLLLGITGCAASTSATPDDSSARFQPFASESGDMSSQPLTTQPATGQSWKGSSFECEGSYFHVTQQDKTGLHDYLILWPLLPLILLADVTGPIFRAADCSDYWKAHRNQQTTVQ